MKSAGRGTGAVKHARAARKAKSQAAQKPAPARKVLRAPNPAARNRPAHAKSAGTGAGKAARTETRKAPARVAAAAGSTQAAFGGAPGGTSPVPARAEERYAGLSEADLMRAPPAQYMSPAQVAFFRERLRAMQRELLQKADLTSEHLRQHDIESDPTDQATIEEEYALELRARDRERKLLKKIEQALRRIEDGSYGYCEETGDAIGIARLLARPTATLSIEAQSRRELKQKLYGD
ncbi:MAG: RNA polymerase-binding protein DksA [Betaproteobacteria bacterium]|nr:RNA polymerase-binding protein DksA [Betaproteobacteria bacterium]